MIIYCCLGNRENPKICYTHWTGKEKSIHPQDFQKLIYQTQKNEHIICGFDTEADDQICRHNGIAIRTDYDLAREIRIAAYGSPAREQQPQGYDYSLEAVFLGNLEVQLYPEDINKQYLIDLWESRKQNYLNTPLRLRLIRRLFRLGQQNNLLDPNTGKLLVVRKLPQI